MQSAPITVIIRIRCIRCPLSPEVWLAAIPCPAGAGQKLRFQKGNGRKHHHAAGRTCGRTAGAGRHFHRCLQRPGTCHFYRTEHGDSLRLQQKSWDRSSMAMTRTRFSSAEIWARPAITPTALPVRSMMKYGTSWKRHTTRQQRSCKCTWISWNCWQSI